MIAEKATLPNILAPITGGIVRVGDDVYGIYFGGFAGDNVDVNKN